MDDTIFTCEVFHTDMPKDKQPGFCARRQRKAMSGDYCGICPIGIAAAKNTKDPKNGGAPDKNNGSIEEEIMASTGIKECLDCKKEYKPTSNVQKRCSDCKEKHNLSKAGIKPKKIRTSSNVSAVAPRRSSGAPRAKSLSVRPSSPSSYLIEIDFASYPKLHERLIDLSSKEHRSPDMQLVHMLDEEFSRAEAGAAK